MEMMQAPQSIAALLVGSALALALSPVWTLWAAAFARIERALRAAFAPPQPLQTSGTAAEEEAKIRALALDVYYNQHAGAVHGATRILRQVLAERTARLSEFTLERILEVCPTVARRVPGVENPRVYVIPTPCGAVDITRYAVEHLPRKPTETPAAALQHIKHSSQWGMGVVGANMHAGCAGDGNRRDFPSAGLAHGSYGPLQRGGVQPELRPEDKKEWRAHRMDTLRQDIAAGLCAVTGDPAGADSHGLAQEALRSCRFSNLRSEDFAAAPSREQLVDLKKDIDEFQRLQRRLRPRVPWNSSTEIAAAPADRQTLARSSELTERPVARGGGGGEDFFRDIVFDAARPRLSSSARGSA